MTVIIGVKCRDGVVLAADSGGTQGFIMQSNKKLYQIGNNSVIGVSGPEGAGQIIRALVERSSKINNHYMDRQKFTNTADVMLAISSSLRPYLLEERAVALKVQMPLDQIDTYTLVALPINDTATLLGFDHVGGSQEITEHLPVVSIGSGALLARPFLGFIRRVLWDNELPYLTDGKMAAYWAMKHTLSLAVGQVAPPINIMALSNRDSIWTVEEFGEPQREGHDSLIADLEDHIRKFRKEFLPGDSVPALQSFVPGNQVITEDQPNPQV